MTKLIRNTKAAKASSTAALIALALALSVGSASLPPRSAQAVPADYARGETTTTVSPRSSRLVASVETTAAAARRPFPKRPRVKMRYVKPKRRVAIRWSTAKVSWYGPGFYGNTMAGGGTLTRNSLVVAHRTLPFGTKVQISYKGRTVVAVVKDRGPYVKGRVFDLGPGTAKRLKFGGVGYVKYRIVRK